MSIVIEKTKSNYKLTLIFEIIFFVVILGINQIFGQNNLIESFGFGGLSVFFPHCLFVFIVFFYDSKSITPLKKLYLGELIKFIFTVLLIVVVLNFFSVNIIAFFIGYIVGILLNNLLPFMINKYLKV